jgi:hypothetical protein
MHLAQPRLSLAMVRAGSDRHYKTQGAENERQCEGERYALLMLEMTTAPTSTAAGNAKTNTNLS